MRTPHRHRPLLVLTFLASLAGACARPAPPAGEVAAEATTARRYTVRGEVRQVTASGVFIEHEAVPDLVDPAGVPSGMDSMTMPFTLAGAATRVELMPGDVVEFVLEVDWEREPPFLVVEVRRLPEETSLKLG